MPSSPQITVDCRGRDLASEFSAITEDQLTEIDKAILSFVTKIVAGQDSQGYWITYHFCSNDYLKSKTFTKRDTFRQKDWIEWRIQNYKSFLLEEDWVGELLKDTYQHFSNY